MANFNTRSSVNSILIVDDVSANRVLLKTQLEMLGFHSEEAENGEQAIAKALAQDFAVIFMDLNMPVMDGKTAVKLLRQLNYDLPIIGCSAENPSQQKADLHQQGFTDFVAKPFDLEEIQALLLRLKIQTKSRKAQNRSEKAYHAKLNQLKQRFIDSAPALIDQIQVSLQKQDTSQLQYLAHQLKGSSSLLGFGAIQEISTFLETALKQQKTGLCPDLAQNLIEQLLRLPESARQQASTQKTVPDFPEAH